MELTDFEKRILEEAPDAPNYLDFLDLLPDDFEGIRQAVHDNCFEQRNHLMEAGLIVRTEDKRGCSCPIQRTRKGRENANRNFRLSHTEQRVGKL